MKPEETQNSRSIPGNKNKAEGFTISDFNLHYKATVIQHGTSTKTKHAYQKKRSEDTVYILNFDKEAKSILWKKISIFNQWWWKNWLHICRRLPCTKSTAMSIIMHKKSTWIKDLDIKIY